MKQLCVTILDCPYYAWMLYFWCGKFRVDIREPSARYVLLCKSDFCRCITDAGVSLFFFYKYFWLLTTLKYWINITVRFRFWVEQSSSSSTYLPQVQCVYWHNFFGTNWSMKYAKRRCSRFIKQFLRRVSI